MTSAVGATVTPLRTGLTALSSAKFNDPALETGVRCVDSPEAINQGSALEQAAWYEEQGIWYDALNSLIQARQAQPHNQELSDSLYNFPESGGLKVEQRRSAR